jgi:hypothetical protein
MTAHSGQILSENGKTEPKISPLWTQASIWKGNEPYFSSDQIDHIAQFRSKFLPCFNTQPISSLFSEMCTPCCFHIVITLVWLNQVSHVRMRRKAEEVIDNAKIASFLRLYWFWVKSSDFSDYANLLRAEFQQSGRLQNYITPKPFIV